MHNTRPPPLRYAFPTARAWRYDLSLLPFPWFSITSRPLQPSATLFSHVLRKTALTRIHRDSRIDRVNALGCAWMLTRRIAHDDSSLYSTTVFTSMLWYWPYIDQFLWHLSTAVVQIKVTQERTRTRALLRIINILKRNNRKKSTWNAPLLLN